MFVNWAIEMSVSYSIKCSLTAKGGLIDSQGLNIVDNKICRFLYNITESISATLAFQGVCYLVNKSLEMYTWQKVTRASIAAMPLVTRGIAHFYSKKPLDTADKLDVKIGQWMNIANIVTCVALLIISRECFGPMTFALNTLCVTLNIALTYY